MKKCITVLLASLALTILSSCGRQTDMPSQSEAEGEVVQWMTEGFAAPGKLEEEQVFWAGQYMPWDHVSEASDAGAEGLSYLDSGVCGELFWYFGAELGSDGMVVLGPEGKYVLEIYDTVTGDCTVKRFTPRELGLEEELGYLEGMDMLDGEHYMLRWADYKQDEEGMYCQVGDRMVYTDLEGDLQTTDLWEIYLEKGIEQEAFTILPWLQPINCRCDGMGNSYVVNNKKDGSFEFYLFDRNGEILLEYEGNSDQQLVEPMRTWNGELILAVYDGVGKSYEFLWTDTAKGELRSLARMEASWPYITQMYGMLGNDIFYRSREGVENGTGEGIVRWNIKSGRRVWGFDFQTAGLDIGYQTMLALREGQTPYLRLIKFQNGKPKEWLTALAEQRPKNDGSVRVVSLTSGEKVEKCVALASMEDPNFNFEYEEAFDEEARDRIMAELLQGKGPDILFVSQDDMYLLEEKGLLLDIGELIPQELKEDLLPGVLEIGTVDGRLVGVPEGVRAETLVVAGNIWQEDTWGLEDIIGLIEEGKLTGAIRSPNLFTEDYLSPSFALIKLLSYSLEDSFLIDWENRKCHFDDERFVRLLEFISTDFNSVTHETEAWLGEGQNILQGYFYFTSSFLDFFVHVEEEEGRIVGYPTEGICGSYLVPDGGVLVVNANIAQKETVSCFLEILLGDELQLKTSVTSLSVRKLNPEDYIVREEDGRLVYIGGDFAPEVPIFQDGATSLHRAKAFLESCVARPPIYGQINMIITEEFEAMYAGNRSPETTAEIINNRVQLYLDEGN